MGFRTWLLVTSIIASGCADQLILEKDEALAVIPRELSTSGHFLVDVEINGKGPFAFAIDTGATISVVFEEVLERTDIEPSAQRVVVHGMVESGNYSVAPVASIQLGDELVRDVRAAVLPGGALEAAGLDGLLGTDILSRYALAYSHTDRVLRLYARELVSARSYREWTNITLTELEVGGRGATAFVFDIAISTEKIPALLDLGCNASLMNWRAARSIGIRPSRNSRETRVAGAFGATTSTVELLVYQARIANLRWRHLQFQVVDLPVFEALGLHDQPVAIVGTDFFQDRDFIIDFERQRLLVRKAD